MAFLIGLSLNCAGTSCTTESTGLRSEDVVSVDALEFAFPLLGVALEPLEPLHPASTKVPSTAPTATGATERRTALNSDMLEPPG
jgi:hypothetical protein